MLGRGVLSTLYTLSQQRTYTLTLYLDIDQNKQSNRRRGYVVQAEALIKGLKSQQARSDRLETACKQALTLIRTFKPKGKTALIEISEFPGPIRALSLAGMAAEFGALIMCSLTAYAFALPAIGRALAVSPAGFSEAALSATGVAFPSITCGPAAVPSAEAEAPADATL